MFHLGAPPDAFAFDPKDARVIYAATGGALAQRGRGRAPGRMVFPDPAQNTVGARLERSRGLRVSPPTIPLYPGAAAT